jgi:4-amino-4-deoxy-L-arabinose transferase-like glycosyltransferase
MASIVPTGTAEREKPENRSTSGHAIVLYLASAKLLLHLVTARYGLFRDELYYLACAQHLAWGYVDQPPMIAWIAWFACHVFGTSPLAIRLLPAFAGAALVWMAGLLAREMGGGRFAQAVAELRIIPVPIRAVPGHIATEM